MNPATDFLQHFQAGTADALIQAYVGFLLRSADAYRLPISIKKVERHFRLVVSRHPLSREQRGFTTEDCRIYLNADDLPTVQNFTFAHELMELLFNSLRDGAADDWMDDDLFTTLLDHKEAYCEQGAAELLMPMPLYKKLVASESLSFDWAQEVAKRCNVSLTATLWRILETGLANALFIVWQLKHKPREYVPSKVGQLNLFGAPELMDPPKKMRIERVFSPPHFSSFVPKEKSAPEISVIRRAYTDRVAAADWEELDLGTIRGRFFVEARPVTIAGERLVMSLIHLT